MLSKQVVKKKRPATRKLKAGGRKETSEEADLDSSESSSESSSGSDNEAVETKNKIAKAAALGRRASAAGAQAPLGSGLQRASSTVHDRNRSNSMLIRHQQTHSQLSDIQRQTTTSQVSDINRASRLTRETTHPPSHALARPRDALTRPTAFA